MGIFSYLLCCGTNQDSDVYNDIYEETWYFGRKRMRDEKERRGKKEPQKMFWRRIEGCFNVFRGKQTKYSLENLIESRRVPIIPVDIFETKTEDDFFNIEVKVEENLTTVDKLQSKIYCFISVTQAGSVLSGKGLVSIVFFHFKA